jgi:hypothetical protein
MDLLLSSTFCTQVLTAPGGRAVVKLQQSVICGSACDAIHRAAGPVLLLGVLIRWVHGSCTVL